MQPLLTEGTPKPLSLAVNLGAQVQQCCIYANGSMCLVALTPSPGPGPTAGIFGLFLISTAGPLEPWWVKALLCH